MNPCCYVTLFYHIKLKHMRLKWVVHEKCVDRMSIKSLMGSFLDFTSGDRFSKYAEKVFWEIARFAG